MNLRGIELPCLVLATNPYHVLEIGNFFKNSVVQIQATIRILVESEPVLPDSDHRRSALP